MGLPVDDKTRYILWFADDPAVLAEVAPRFKMTISRNGE